MEPKIVIVFGARSKQVSIKLLVAAVTALFAFTTEGKEKGLVLISEC